MNILKNIKSLEVKIMFKLIKYLSLFIITFFIGNSLVSADINDHIVDFNKKGTISITLKDPDDINRIKGAEITIYHVATVSSKNNKLVYTYNDTIKDCKGDLSDLTNESLTSEINKCITDEALPSQKKLTNNEGTVKFENLELGLYLVKQTNNVEGYSNIDPFLVNIPKELDNKWTYDIKAEPKTDIIRLMDVIVEKRWDVVGSENTPDSVTIELLKGEEVIDTVILNNENNWTHSWQQIPESDEYKVKEINIPREYTPTYRQEGNKFIVTNTKTLVQTGQNILIIEILSIVGLLLIITGVIYDKRKNYE